VKDLVWLASTLKDVREFPRPVQRGIGYALYLAQSGDKHPDAKPLRGFGGAGVLEIVERFDGDTYRAVYTVRLEHAVYVLHAFQKKSTSGIGTSRQDLALIRTRLRVAQDEDRGSTE
jgi:phage-related protein